jgi:hypothetical protein
MIETLIIADDLSGWADTAVACTCSGAATTVLIDVQAAPRGAKVVAVDVNSRAMAPDKAGLAAAAAVATLCSPVRRSWTKADGGRLGVLRRYRSMSSGGPCQVGCFARKQTTTLKIGPAPVAPTTSSGSSPARLSRCYDAAPQRV